MENKVFYKKYIRRIIVACIIFFFIIIAIYLIGQNHYKAIFNRKISTIIGEIEEKYPDISSEKIFEILNSKSENLEPLRTFGYDIEKDDFFLETKKSNKYFTISLIIVTISFTGIIVHLFVKFSSKNDTEIDKIIKTLERINQRKYDLELDSLTEDKFSILKNEIYKTTVMLKEVAQNQENAKNDLKNSLSDISHQLKTPLTSILIMLDDIIDDKDMPTSTRDNFLKSIRREIVNINFLVQSLLKLSKFDADAIEFKRKETDLEKIITGAIENISTLADLKSVKVEYYLENPKKIICDEHWQTEALTNIIKNAIEHSKENGIVKIETKSNDLFTSIAIIDGGIGMSKKDMKHIFERFYKGENASKDSIGIGLPLAKVIIEQDDGKIFVESEIGKGTIFTIKYFKNLKNLV